MGIAVMVGGAVGGNIWLSEWSSDSVLEHDEAAQLMTLRLGVYGALGMVQGQ